jgi:hypothetical protein
MLELIELIAKKKDSFGLMKVYKINKEKVKRCLKSGVNSSILVRFLQKHSYTDS